jgi:hypothetical protein
MKSGDYLVTTKQLRPGRPVEIDMHPVTAAASRAKAVVEAMGLAGRLAQEGFPFCVQLHRVLDLDGEGIEPELLCDFYVDDRGEQIEDAMADTLAELALLGATGTPASGGALFVA